MQKLLRISMPKDSPTKMRRDDRSAGDEWIMQFLKVSPFGVLATISNNQPFLNTNTFYYDEKSHSIFIHTAKHGRTRSNSEETSAVCFSVAKMGRLLPADTATELSVEYEAVIIFGEVSIVTDKNYSREMMKLLIKKYFGDLKYGRDIKEISPKEIDDIAVFQIKIDKWSGKVKKADDNFPGAFYYTS